VRSKTISGIAKMEGVKKNTEVPGLYFSTSVLIRMLNIPRYYHTTPFDMEVNHLVDVYTEVRCNFGCGA
jgi:hypothetical protein